MIGPIPKRIPRCPTCGAAGIRNERHDTYACRACDVWLETSPDGEHFPPTPERPSMAEWGDGVLC